jgi:steroid 5-alpha reductase family enzyme
MFGFFQVQAAVSMFLSIAFAVPSYRPDSPGAVAMAIAIALWLIAVAGEALADRQLRSFAADPANRGKTCRAGLWRYSRHPNYFFECVHWLAYVPLALGTPWAWLTLLPPVAMAWLLIKVSGVPMLEAHMRATRDDYAEYARTTSVLIPWPPRH